MAYALAMSSVATRTVTGAEFARLPEPAHGGKMELIRGEVVTMAPVGPEHGESAVRLGYSLHQFGHENHLGRTRVETGYWLGSDPDHILAPDVSFVAAKRVLEERLKEGFVDRPPSLAVEVTSPNDKDYEVNAKVADYLAAGVDRVWVVRPELRSVTVYRRGGEVRLVNVDGVLTSDDAGFELEGFELPLAVLFAD